MDTLDPQFARCSAQNLLHQKTTQSLIGSAKPLQRHSGRRAGALVLLLAAIASSTACGAGTLLEANGPGSVAGASASGSPANGAPTSAPDAGSAGSGGSADPNAASAGVPAVFSPNFVVGVLPDYDNAATDGLLGYIKRTGFVPMASSGYVNVGPNGAIETSTGIGYIDEAKKNGVGIISLSLTARQTGSLTDAQTAGIQKLIDEAKSQNIDLYLRYGYEMNYGGGSEQYQNINEHNDPKDFLAQWEQVAQLANPSRNSSPSVKMFWSPNIQSGGTLPYTSWEPTNPNTIDMVGVDWYHTPGDTISVKAIESTVASIYTIASGLHIPFMLGETGVSTTEQNSSEAAEKIQWLKALTDSQLLADLPYYQGFYYFDYEKNGTNFSVSQDSSVVSLFSAWYKQAFPNAVASGSSR